MISSRRARAGRRRRRRSWCSGTGPSIVCRATTLARRRRPQFFGRCTRACARTCERTRQRRAAARRSPCTAAPAPRRPARGRRRRGSRAPAGRRRATGTSGSLDMSMPARWWNSVRVKPGQQRRGGDPGAGELAGEALGEDGDARLRGGVGARGRSEPATDETLTMAPWPRSRMARAAACESTSTARPSTSNTASSSVRSLRGSALEGVAGVVDQQVDGPGLGRRAARRPCRSRRGRTGRRRGSRRADAVLGAQLVGDVLEARPVAGHEHDVVAALGELVGEGQADAGAGAGHEGSAHVPHSKRAA